MSKVVKAIYLCPFKTNIFKLLHRKTKYPGELVSSNTQMIQKLNLRVWDMRSRKNEEIIL